MSLLFVNACMRNNSRTEKLARMWLENYHGEVQELPLYEIDVQPLVPRHPLEDYLEAVATGSYESSLFDFARDFAAADEILIAAPFWNFSIPAHLHCYLELVCSQGVTFDIDEKGAYYSLCHARKITFVCTAGGIIDPANDHAGSYLKTLARIFWGNPAFEYVFAQGLDAENANVDALLAAALGEGIRGRTK